MSFLATMRRSSQLGHHLFCGHIHTGDHEPLTITHEDGSTTVCFNVSRLDERYEIVYEPRLLEI